MEEFRNILETQLFNLGGVGITIGELLVVLLTIVLVVLLTRIIVGTIARRMLVKGRDENLVLLVRRLIWTSVLAVLFFATLGLLKVPLTAFAFLSGAVAIGVGFGAQNIINNFISGWILMGEQPIRIGDLLEIDGTLGHVEAISTRSTRIRRVDGVRIVVPNSTLLENTVVNWTLVDNEVRSLVRVSVAYGSPTRKVAELLEQAAKEQNEVLDNPAVVVIFEDFGDSALVFDLFFFSNLRPGGDLRKLRSAIRFRIEELFNENGIVISFPQRDVHLDGTLRLENTRD